MRKQLSPIGSPQRLVLSPRLSPSSQKSSPKFLYSPRKLPILNLEEKFEDSLRLSKIKTKFISYRIIENRHVELVRKTRHHVREIVCTGSNFPSRETPYISLISDTFCTNSSRKFFAKVPLKVKLDNQIDISMIIRKFHKFARLTRHLSSITFCQGININQSALPTFSRFLRYNATKTLHSISLKGYLAHENHEIPNLVKLFSEIEKFKLESFTFATFMIFTNPLDTRDIALYKRAIQSLIRIRSLTFLYLQPLKEFLYDQYSLSYLLNHFPKLCTLYIPPLEDSDSDREFIKDIQLFPNIQAFYSRILYPHKGILSRILTEATKLSIINIELLPECMTSGFKNPSNYKISPRFQLFLNNISRLKNLEQITIAHKTIPTSHKTSYLTLLSIQSLSSLTKLTKLTIHSNFSSRRMLVSFQELGETISQMKSLRYISIHSFATSRALEDLFQSRSKDLTSLQEIIFDFSLDEELIIKRSFLDWMQTKNKLESFSIMLGVSQVHGQLMTISPMSLRYLAMGISSVRKLRYLKFCCGIDEVRQINTPNKHSIDIFTSFLTTSQKTIISDMISNLSSLKKLILKMGAGYFSNEEIASLMKMLGKRKNLYSLALGGNFNKAPKSIFELVSYIDKNADQIRKFYFSPFEDENTNFESEISLINSGKIYLKNDLLKLEL